MPARMEELARRREALIARSARLRQDLKEDAAELGRGFPLARRLVKLGGSGAGKTLLLALASLLVLRRPRSMLSLAAKGLAYYPVVEPLIKRLWARRRRRRIELPLEH
jgi:DNA replication protein DnaC